MPAKEWGVRASFPDGLYKALKAEAALRGLTIAGCLVELVREAVGSKFKERK